MLSANDEERLVKIRMVFPEFLLLDFSVDAKINVRETTINHSEISSAANANIASRQVHPRAFGISQKNKVLTETLHQQKDVSLF